MSSPVMVEAEPEVMHSDLVIRIKDEPGEEPALPTPPPAKPVPRFYLEEDDW